MQIRQVLVSQLVIVFRLKFRLVSANLGNEVLKLFLLDRVLQGYKLFLHLFSIFLFSFQQIISFYCWVFRLLLFLLLNHRVIPTPKVQLILFVSQSYFLLSMFQIG